MSLHLLGFESESIHDTVAVITDDGQIRYFNQNEIGFHLALHATHYGTAVLEGMQECSGKILFVPEHWQRICLSARTTGIMSQDDTSLELGLFRTALVELYQRNRCRLTRGDDGHQLPMYFRPLVVEGSCLLGVGSRSKWTCIIITRDKTPYLGAKARTGVTIWAPGPKHLRRADTTNGFPHVKASINYGLGYQWKGRAVEHDAVEVVQYDARGKHWSETTGSNIFVEVEEGIVHTTPLGAILDGINRRRSIAALRAMGYTVIDDQPITKRRVNRARGVFLTGTWSGIVPVRQVKVGYPHVLDGVIYPCCPTPLMRALQQQHDWLLQGDPRCALKLDPDWHTLTE